MATFKATGRIAIGGGVVEPGEQFEADEQALRALVSRGMVEQVEQEHKPKAKAKRGKR